MALASFEIFCYVVVIPLRKILWRRIFTVLAKRQHWAGLSVGPIWLPHLVQTTQNYNLSSHTCQAYTNL